MSDLIRRRREVTTTQSLEPLAQPTSAATAPASATTAPASVATASALMDHLAVGPAGSQAPASSASSVAQPVSARIRRVHSQDERHRAAPTAELHSSLAQDIGHVVRSHCPMKWMSWKVMPDEIKTEWKSDLHHYFEAFDDPQVALEEGCLKELEGRVDSWAWLCAHFQASTFVNKAKVNKGNRKKKTLLHFGESRLDVTDDVEQTKEQVKIIRERLKTAQDRQKSYADNRRKDLQFKVGDWVFLKLSPWKGVVRFRKRGKLSPRYIGPYEVVERVGPVAYRLALPLDLSRLHDVFHVSMLRKYISDPSHVLEEQPIELKEDLTYVEQPVQILDRKMQVLRSREIPFVKVLWRSHTVEEATWEPEDQMREQYPYLFE
ncbi:hypothetical protein L3X38_024307 [Prunus dulcis]|uniref:Tf2-1-like SH3-like domain-containing protein n=1 Tax=Prunus dulcis TaxID=3755 RepID=A0AAD4W163_PRUDU|nr:hypothetical protein L3X38_024307 [Prunus dulcis]